MTGKSWVAERTALAGEAGSYAKALCHRADIGRHERSMHKAQKGSILS